MNTMKTICTTASVTARRSLAALCLSLMLAQALFTPFTSAAAVPKVKTDDTSLPCEARPNFTLAAEFLQPANGIACLEMSGWRKNGDFSRLFNHNTLKMEGATTSSTTSPSLPATVGLAQSQNPKLSVGRQIIAKNTLAPTLPSGEPDGSLSTR